MIKRPRTSRVAKQAQQNAQASKAARHKILKSKDAIFAAVRAYTKEPARLYDEISQEQAEKSASYFIGYFKEGKLSRYEKIYKGERAFSSEDIKR